MIDVGAYDITIDFDKMFTQAATSIYFKTGDINTSKIKAKLTKKGEIIDLTGVTVSTKIDITTDVITDSATVTDAENGIIEYTFPTNALIEGINFFELILTEGENVKESQKLAYKVIGSIDDVGAVEAETNYPVLIQLISDTNIVMNNAISATNDAIVATTNADNATQNAINATNDAIDAKNMVDQAIASGTVDLEVIGARDGEATLNERLERDLAKGKTIYADVEGTYISEESVDGWVENVEILGNTYQNPLDLAEISSVGDELEGGRFEIPLLCRNKNFLSPVNIIHGYYIDSTNGITYGANATRSYYDFIKIKSSETIKISGCNVTGFYQYDKNKNFIKQGGDHNLPIVLESNTCYIRLTINNTIDYSKAQLEYSSVATTYEEPQTHELTILLDEPLRGQGIYKDRIVQLSDGIWYKEKNRITYRFTGNETITSGTSANGSYIGQVVFNDAMSITSNDTIGVICDKLTGLSANSQYTTNNQSIAISTSKTVKFLITGALNATDVKTWLTTNTPTIEYPLATPTFIPLSDDQQVALRTFANKTNILSLCEIEPTIKGSVPKSISASINSINEHLESVDSEIEKIKKLEDATTSTVTTDSDFVSIQETGNGFLSDIKLEGRTLNNLGGTIIPGQSGIGAIVTNEGNVYKITKGSTTTYMKFALPSSIIGKNITFKVSDLSSNLALSSCYFRLYNRSTSEFYGASFILDNVIKNNNSFVCSFPSTINSSDVLELLLYLPSNAIEGVDWVKCNNKILILEGDHTQNPPNGYFEGLKSVGQDVDELVVSSSNNPFDNTKIYKQSDSFSITVNELYPNGFSINANDYDSGSAVYYKTSLKKGIQYKISCDNIVNITNIRLYPTLTDMRNNTNSVVISTVSGDSAVATFIPTYDNMLLRFWITDPNNKLATVKNINIQKNGETNDFKYDKKQILYLDTADSTWKKPTLRGMWSNGALVVGDTIEKHSDGKYYYHKRCGGEVLDGSELDSLFVTRNQPTDTSLYRLATTKVTNSKKGSIVICNNFENITDSYELEGISCHSVDSNIDFVISQTKATDLASFKTWLSTNNVTLVYELDQYEEYECTPIDLSSYDSETNFINESGVLCPRSTIKVQNFIGNIINTMKEKISIQENENNFLMANIFDHEVRLSLIEGGM